MKYKVGDIVRFLKNCPLSEEETIYADSVWRVKEVFDAHYELTHKDKYLRDEVLMIKCEFVDDCCEEVNTAQGVAERINDKSSTTNGMIMTNADKIRGMDDEQLADWIMQYVEPCSLCAYHKCAGDCSPPPNTDCETGRLEWLKQECKEANNEL